MPKTWVRALPIVAAALMSSPVRSAPISIVVERRFPVNLYCPIDNTLYNLTFVAQGPQVRLTFEGNNEFEANWLHRRLDNIAVEVRSGETNEVTIALEPKGQ